MFYMPNFVIKMTRYLEQREQLTDVPSIFGGMPRSSNVNVAIIHNILTHLQLIPKGSPMLPVSHPMPIDAS
jgi:hypothetical protein